jgi:6-phosphogluconolactonase
MSHPGLRVKTLPDSAAAASAAAAEVARRARFSVADHGSFTLAVSGGRSPWAMLAELAVHDMPWDATTLYQVDERIGPAEDPQRNLIGLRRALPPRCPVRIVPMPVEATDLDAACGDYAAALPGTLDLIHLGLGADGHTASLIPGDPVLEVTDADVALTCTYQDRRRMTLTYPRIARAHAILWLVTGAGKRTALAQLLTHDPGIPAGRVVHPAQVLFCDTDAAGAGLP